ncbi:MAG: ribulose-phosphate 3-epimerase [Bacteroidia bacterium]|nr:ribulose-phosphate 3-epimerase [Bacteroidia bacterium]
MKKIVAPSILASNFGKLDEEIEMINRSEAGWIHCDIMDGNFVPNISFGIPVLKAVKEVSKKPLDVHLMIEKPSRYIQAFKDAGADNLTVHLEALVHLDRVIHAIREAGMRPGVAVNPSSSLDGLAYILPELEQVCLMTVNPGFGGQKFIPYSIQKVRDLKEMIERTGSSALIEIDGGVDHNTAPALVEAGADVLVAGSYVFKADNPEKNIAKLNQLLGN